MSTVIEEVIHSSAAISISGLSKSFSNNGHYVLEDVHLND